MIPDASWNEESLVRTPDARRKRLLAKLAGQGGRGAIPLPGRFGAYGGEGRAFGPGRLSRTHVTGPHNLLASVLARLGALGHPGNADEVSPGQGAAIGSPPGPSHGFPNPLPVGPPIPTPGLPPVTPPGIGGPPGGGQPTVEPLGGGPYGGAPTHTPTGQGGAIPLNGSPASLVGLPSGASPNVVPLGGGLYYDPMTDTVIGGSAGAGSAVHRL